MGTNDGIRAQTLPSLSADNNGEEGGGTRWNSKQDKQTATVP
ncbi:hypothetical protein [Paenibacillus sp. AN1007]|uniref:Uncharacterized protein n=1 Tax=Paenibacillus sp. AN1007 TaxID=3151385 RepID=A0AAU8N7L1_9BACL